MPIKRLIAATLKPSVEPRVEYGPHVIDGNIPNDTNLTIYGNTKVNGRIGDRVKLRIFGNLNARDIGRESEVIALAVNAGNAGEDTSVTSIKKDLRLKNVSLRVHMDSARDLFFNKAFGLVTGRANRDASFNRLGSYSSLEAGHIEGSVIGTNCYVRSTIDHVEVDGVCAHTNVDAARNLQIKRYVSPKAKLHYGLENLSAVHNRTTWRKPEDVIESLGYDIYRDRRTHSYIVPSTLIEPGLKHELNSRYDINLYIALSNLKGVIYESISNPQGAPHPEHLSETHELYDGAHSTYTRISCGDQEYLRQRVRDAINTYIWTQNDRAR